MFNEKYSHEKKFNYDSSNCTFIELKEYATTMKVDRFIVRGMFTYQGKKGERAAVVTDGYLVNVPTHLNEDVKSILSNGDEIEAINNGKCAFKITTYEDTKFGNGICYSGSFVDN